MPFLPQSTHIRKKGLITLDLVIVLMYLEIEDEGCEGLDVLQRPLELGYLTQVVVLHNTELRPRKISVKDYIS